MSLLKMASPEAMKCSGKTLALFRIAFGTSMIVDTLYERGMTRAEVLWEEDKCLFPVFHFLRPLPLDWMYFVYFIMLIGSVSICVGFKFKINSRIYCVCYWFVILQDKLKLNNHSYLFGLVTFLLSFTDAHSCMSIDAWLKNDRNTKFVPFWQYFILRSQVFLVYFIAGIKKFDPDWRSGYSMRPLTENWVFAPFNSIWGKEHTSTFIHQSGLWIDLLIGFFLVHSLLKPIGLFISASFNVMNACAFSIGVFPYVMLASNILFLDSDFTNYLTRRIDMKSFKSKTTSKTTKFKNSTSCCLILYLMIQSFLPFSHFIFKGYTNWTEGFYGYSWDMMVHRWHIHHIRMGYFNNDDPSDYGYLKPEFFSAEEKWVLNPGSIFQMASCIERRLAKNNFKDVSLYFDLWLSLNGRVIQRATDPTVDILSHRWSPFAQPSFVLPLIKQFDDLREFLADFKVKISKTYQNSTQTYVADFPGMIIQNMVPGNASSVRLLLLEGNVTIEIHPTNVNSLLAPGDLIEIPPGSWYEIITISPTPSCMLFLQKTIDVGTEPERNDMVKDRSLKTTFVKSMSAIRRIFTDMWNWMRMNDSI